jgi:hypothetical protein
VARLSVTNVVEEGVACSETDTVGDPNLDEKGRPTRESTLIVDRATARWAPRVDLGGARRGPHPDIGAYEYTAPEP